MKCEKCREEIKPVVLCDIDGTIAEYHNTLGEFCGEYWDIAIPMNSWNGKGNFEDYLGLTQQEYREAKLAFRQGGMKRTMPMYPETKLLMNNIHRTGAELWFTTTRPWQRLDNVDPDTRFWLDRHGLEYHRLLFDDDKYHRVCQIIDPERIVLVIDDLPEQIDAATGLGLPVWQPGRPHNSHPSQQRQPRGTLAQAAVVVHQHVRKWYERNT